MSKYFLPDLVNVFEVFLPQLLLYPNPSDPLNGEAAALMMRDRASYEQRVKGIGPFWVFIFWICISFINVCALVPWPAAQICYVFFAVFYFVLPNRSHNQTLNHGGTWNNFLERVLYVDYYDCVVCNCLNIECVYACILTNTIIRTSFQINLNLVRLWCFKLNQVSWSYFLSIFILWHSFVCPLQLMFMNFPLIDKIILLLIFLLFGNSL